MSVEREKPAPVIRDEVRMAGAGIFSASFEAFRTLRLNGTTGNRLP